jgi:hypothetical protein
VLQDERTEFLHALDGAAIHGIARHRAEWLPHAALCSLPASTIATTVPEPQKLRARSEKPAWLANKRLLQS